MDANGIKHYYDVTRLIQESCDKDFVAVVSSGGNHLVIDIYGRQSKTSYVHVGVKDPQAFIDDLPKIMDSKIKTVIFQVFEFKNEKFPDNVQFCKALKAKFESLLTTKISYGFISDFDFAITHQLVATDINVNVGEYVLILGITKNRFRIIELKYSADGYEVVRFDQEFDMNDREHNDEELREIILESEPEKILLHYDNASNPVLKTLQEILSSQSKKFVLLSDEMIAKKKSAATVIEISKWILDNNDTKFHVCPTLERAFRIGYRCGNKDYSLLPSDPHLDISLPSEELFIVPKSCFEHYVGYPDDESPSKSIRCETFTLDDAAAHEFEVTLKVDVNNFPSYEVKGCTVDRILALPMLGSSEIERSEKSPIIGLYDNYSFICVWDEEKDGYKFLETWGGQWGRPMHIAFDKEKPYTGEEAEALFGKCHKFVVSDLLEIMSCSEEEVKEFDTRGYTFTSDDENPILLEFDNFDGTKKAASPAFLFALLLKDHIKAIKKETGERPNHLCLSILNDFDDEEIERIQECWVEALDLLKINNCTFLY